MSAPQKGAPVRHFLDLLEVPSPELRDIMDASAAMKAARVKGQPPIAAAARRQDAGDDFRSSLDAHARLLRSSAMRELGGETIMLTGAEMQLGRGETHRRHRARAVALCRRDHDPHPRPRGDGGAGAPRHRAGHQRPDQTIASLPGDGRYPDLRGALRRHPRAQDRLERRLQQCPVLLDRRRAALRFLARHRLPAPAAAASRAARRSASAGRQSHHRRGPFRRRRRRGRRHLRLLGFDGRRGRGAPPQSARALSGQRRADGRGGDGRDLHALPARPSRRGSHRRSHRRPAIGRSSTKRKIACMRRKAFSPGAWEQAPHERLRPPSRAVSDAAQDDIVVPFLVEPLEHARPRRASGAGDRFHPQASRLSRADRPHRRRGGGADGAARHGAQDRGQLSIADQDRWRARTC